MGLFKKKNNNEDIVESSTSFFKWTQEFTKKIVTIAFIIFVLVNVFVLAILLLSYLTTGELQYLDILISESNQTFRDVIGGYIIKAATENIVKISGSIIDRLLDIKYKSNKDDKEIEVNNSELFNESEYTEADDPLAEVYNYDSDNSEEYENESEQEE